MKNDFSQQIWRGFCNDYQYVYIFKQLFKCLKEKKIENKVSVVFSMLLYVGS